MKEVELAIIKSTRTQPESINYHFFYYHKNELLKKFFFFWIFMCKVITNVYRKYLILIIQLRSVYYEI